MVPKGFFNIEPYLFVTDTFAAYDAHWHSHSTPKNISGNLQLFLQVGLAERWDYQINPQAFYTHVEHAGTAVRFGDLPMGVDYQLLRESRTLRIPRSNSLLKSSFQQANMNT